ncbi:vomeronasal 1 receptor cavPorV1R667 [Cavia porcellus]|uniref:vomeronasal 1 receptor cavPorV1R667 n=1 Tax=Cavia porcellus TaxID=10141 RepID=UPI000184C7AD|nr:vomeronasal 1 receptor cavPorV1R667 [Cavia porcellus]
MIWSSYIKSAIALPLLGPGIIVSTLIFVRYVYTFVKVPEKRPINSILIHLVFSNVVIISVGGIGIISTVFCFRNFPGNVGSKTMVYLGRVARGLSICTTCLLSMVQAITISPRNSLCRKLKPQTAWQVLPHVLLFWVCNFLISSNLLYYVTIINSTNCSGIGMYISKCYMLPSQQMVRWLFLSLMTLRDITFQSLMSWSSVDMAVHLHKHHKRVFYLHSSKFRNNSSPEITAIQNTLILMTCFLFFYWADFIFSFYIGSITTPHTTIVNIKLFLELGFAILSPYVLISRDIHVVNCWHCH